MHFIDLHEFAAGNNDSPVGVLLPPPPPPVLVLHCPDPHHRLHSPPLQFLLPGQPMENLSVLLQESLHHT